MGEDLVYILLYTSAFANLLPTLVAITRWRYLNSSQKYLAVLVIISAFTELVAYIIAFEFKKPNTPLLHLFTLVEFIFLINIYRINKTVNKVGTWSLIIVFSIIAVISALQWDSIFAFKPNSTARTLESLILLIMGVGYFFSRLSNLTKGEHNHLKLTSTPMFWINTAILIYFPASLFIFLFGPWFLGENAYSYNMFAIHAMLTIVKSLLYAIALWGKPQPSLP